MRLASSPNNALCRKTLEARSTFDSNTFGERRLRQSDRDPAFRAMWRTRPVLPEVISIMAFCSAASRFQVRVREESQTEPKGILSRIRRSKFNFGVNGVAGSEARSKTRVSGSRNAETLLYEHLPKCLQSPATGVEIDASPRVSL